MSSFVPLPSVSLWGFAASLVARALRSSLARGEFDGLHPQDRGRLVRLVEEIEAAATAWVEDRERRNETPGGEVEVCSEAMTTETAAAVLNVTARRAQQLAAGGLGVKRNGRWLLDRALVLGEAERRKVS